MPPRLTLSSLPPDRSARCLPPTVVPTAAGVLVVQALPLSVRFAFRETADGPDVAAVELTNAQYELVVVGVDTGILAARLGLLVPPAAVQ